MPQGTPGSFTRFFWQAMLKRSASNPSEPSQEGSSSAGIKYSNIVPVQDTGPVNEPSRASVRARQPQCFLGTCLVAIAR